MNNEEEKKEELTEELVEPPQRITELLDLTMGIEGTGRRRGSVQDRAEVIEFENVSPDCMEGPVSKFKNEGLEEIQKEQNDWEAQSSRPLEPSEKPSEKIPGKKKPFKSIEEQFEESWVNKQFPHSRWIPPPLWGRDSWEPTKEPKELRVLDTAWFSLIKGKGQINIIEIEDPILTTKINSRKRCRHGLVEEWCGRCIAAYTPVFLTILGAVLIGWCGKKLVKLIFNSWKNKVVE